LGDRLYADIAADDWARLRATVDGLTSDQPQATCECRLASGGGVRWVTWSLMGAFTENGTLAAFQLVGRDATRAREAETRADRQRQQMMQADKMIALGLLTSSVAHEVSNPNQVITMNAELLARIWRDVDAAIVAHQAQDAGATYGGLPAATVRAKAPDLIANLAAAAKRIAGIVGDLREFSRGGEVRSDEAVDINAVCRAAMSLLGHYLRPERCRFTVDLADDLPAVRGNAGRLEQVLVNLLTNAVQALAHAGQEVVLRTRIGGDGAVQIVVQDSGQGIPARLLPHVSSPFVTSKGAVGGTGLGLWVTTGIVRDHGGTIAFDSQPGRGTTVTVTLPAVPRSA
jgi:polar amino acid transport system substrate-binding protein